MPRLLQWPPAQALQGRDSWSPLTHFPYLRVTHFHSIKGLELVLGWNLALLVVGDCAVFPCGNRVGRAPLHLRLGFKLSPQAQMGVCPWQGSRNVSGQAGTHFPGDLGLQVEECTCVSLVALFLSGSGYERWGMQVCTGCCWRSRPCAQSQVSQQNEEGLLLSGCGWVTGLCLSIKATCTS